MPIYGGAWRRSAGPLQPVQSAGELTCHVEAVRAASRIIAGVPADPTVDLAPAASTALLLPALWPRLRDRMPTHSLASLAKAAHYLNGERNEMILREVETIAQRLNAVGITPVALKGAAHLLTDLWPDKASRIMTDVDLLVKESDVELAKAAIWPEDKAHDVAEVTSNLAYDHHLPARPGPLGFVSVELHVQPLSKESWGLLSSTELLNSATTVALGSTMLKVPAPTHQAMIALVHGPLGHGGIDIVPRDRLDLVFLARRHKLDWDAIFARLQAQKLEYIAELANRTFVDLTDAKGPFENLTRRARRQAARLRRRATSPNGLKAHFLAHKIGRNFRRLRRHRDDRMYVLRTLANRRFWRSLLTYLKA